MRKIIAILFVLLSLCGVVAAEEDTTTLYVTASQLYGRANPRKTAIKETFFDYGFDLQATGRFSKDGKWVEVKGGECGYVWVSVDYVTERRRSFYCENENNKKVKIRRSPVTGKVVGYLKQGKTIEITQVVLGWGRCKTGWIDLEYLVELDEALWPQS